MRIRQALALTLSSDLHQIAKEMRDVDYVLRDASTGLRNLIVNAPEELRTDRLGTALEEILADVIEAQHLAIHARAELTGRSPAALLRERP